MTKVLFWNLRNFTESRVTAARYANAFEYSKVMNYLLSAANLADIFVLIEEYHRNGSVVQGQLAEGSGALGVISLLVELNKGITPAPVWALVPPVVTGSGGKREAIAVYYKFNSLTFTGPWEANGNSTDPVASSPYSTTPVDWQSTLPHPDVNKGGQWVFKNKAGGNYDFPIPGMRHPWLVTFQEITGGRNLQIIGFHAPAPNSGGTSKNIGINPVAALVNLGQIQELNYAGTSVIGGDFNIDANISQGDQVYTNFVKATSYTRLFSTKLPQTKLFPKTSLRDSGSVAFPNFTNYPSYDYGSSAYDQIFVKKTAIQNAMIVEPVIGVDWANNGPGKYGFSPTQPNAGGTAGFTFPTMMTNDLPTILATTAPGNQTNYFRAVGNYAHIRYTSDHMGVICEI